MQTELLREDQSRSPEQRLRPQRSRTDCPILLSPRLVLRAPHEDDIDALAHLANNANVGLGKDHTIFALTAGNVNFRTKANGRVYVSVAPKAEAAE